MDARRWPWLASAGLLLASAVAAAWSVYLHWLPCRGTMLNGSILLGFTYPREFGDACLRRMDTGLPFPYPPEPGEQTAWASELGVAATVLTGLAWLVLVVGSAWEIRTKAIAVLPGLLTLGLAGHAAVAVGRTERSVDGPMALWVLMELLTVVAVAAVLLREPGARWWSIAALLVVAWGSTAMGGLHQVGDYVGTATFSDANWDLPPGTGYLTAAGLLVAGGLTLAYAIRWPRPAQPADRARSSLLDVPV